jgi:hypothetical protein
MKGYMYWLYNRFLPAVIFLLGFGNACFAQNVVINEALTSNVLICGDEEREFDDWIELYNPSDQTVVLTGHYLSDDLNNLSQWQFPGGTEIPSKAYLLLWADGQPEQGNLHCNFRLSSESGVIALVAADGATIIDSLSYGLQKPDISLGRYPDGGEKGYFFLHPTPGSANASGYRRWIAAPAVVNPSGFYPAPLTITINAADEQDEIFFTLDGSEPDYLSSKYTSSFSLDQTSVLKVRASRETTAISDVVVRTYFINTSHALPVLSVATDPDNLFSDSIGIYINYRAEGRAWERKTELHYFKDEMLKFQSGAGIRIQGNSSVFMPKKSFRLFFRDDYGSDRLNWPVFNNTPVQSYKNLVLRAGYDEDITTAQGTLLRDPVITELWRRMGYLTSHSKYGILYLNNDFWGIYDIRESINEYFIVDHLYITDFDLIRYRYSDWELKYGSESDWQYTIDFFDSCDLTTDSAFAEADRLIDIDNYTSLHALMHFTQYRSWYYGAYTVKGKYPRAKWQWTIWDMDRSYTDMSWNGFDHYDDPNNPFWNNIFISKLLQNGTYKNYFINRHLDLYNTLFRPEYVLTILDSLAAEITPEIPLEAVRWNSSVSKWETNVENLRNFIRQRPARVLQQMTAYFELDTVVSITLDIADGGGNIHINSIKPTQFPWSGKYYPEIPITVRAVAKEGFTFRGWSDPELPFSDELTIFPREGLTLTARFEPQYASALKVIHPKWLPGNSIMPVVIRMQDQAGYIDPFSEPVFSVTNADTVIILKKGTASFVANPQDTSDFLFSITHAQIGAYTQTIAIDNEIGETEHAGALPEGELQWDAHTVHTITGDLYIPAGTNLTILPGAWIVIDNQVNWTVEGNISAIGREDNPIIFISRTTMEPWGGMAFNASHAEFAYCFFINGGGDFGKGWAHTGRQPILFARENTQLSLNNCFIIASPGKALGAEESKVSINKCLIERVFHGGEFHYTHLNCTYSHIMNIPSDDHIFADEDNDGFHIDYVNPDIEDYSIINRCYFITGKDDAVDHHQSRLRITNCWIEDWMHEGVAASGSDTVHIFNTVVKKCEQGIEDGWGDTRVFVNHCFITENNVGLRFGDNYTREYNGYMQITNSILYNNDDNIKNYINPSGEMVADAIDISFSITNDAAYDDAPYCFSANPVYDKRYYLKSGSPGIGLAQAGRNIGRTDSLALITSPVIINEIMFNPANEMDTHDWIELFNPQPNVQDLSGWVLRDNDDEHQFHLPPETAIAPNAYLILSQDTSAFRTFHPTITCTRGNFPYGLGDIDQVRLYSPIGQCVDSIVYDEMYRMDTEGFTLELIDYYKDNSSGTYWQYSHQKGGTPGAANSTLSSFPSPVISKTNTFILEQNYPNPFNQETRIRFSLPEPGKIKLTLYNILGQKLKVLIANRHYAAGNYSITFNANHLASGIYFYHITLQYPNGVSVHKTRKMILLK